MAGANNVEKRLPCDREERIHLKELSPSYYSRFVNPGPIGTTTVPGNNLIDPVSNVLNPISLRYPFLAPIIPVSGVLDAQQVTNDQYWDGTVANALSTPSAATLAAYVGQKYLTSLGIGELGATARTALQNELDGFETTVENDDPTNTKTITFGAGISPASIAFLPKTISVVRWEFTRNNPPALRVYVLSVTSSTSGLPVPNPPTPVVFPIGILANDGTTIFGRTIVSTDPELVVTNGDGTTGNPSLNINLTGAGLIPGGVVQNAINYFGEIFNALNGFSAYYSDVVPFPVPANTNIPPAFLLPTDDGTIISHPYGYIGTGYNAATATFTVPVTSPVQAKVRYQIDLTAIGNFMANTATGLIEAQVWDVTNGVNVDGAIIYGPANVITSNGEQGGTMSFGGEYMLTPGNTYRFALQNTDVAIDAQISYAHWSIVRVA